MIPPTRRLFFAIWLQDPVAATLHRIGADLAQAGGGRAVLADHLHVTLAFLGEVDDSRRAELDVLGARVAATHRRFPLVLDTIDRWEHNRIDWAGASAVPAALFALAQQLRESLADAGFAVEPPRFVPHVTLARKGRAGAIARPFGMTPLPLEVEELRLVESRRAEGRADYVPLARWPLTAGGAPIR